MKHSLILAAALMASSPALADRAPVTVPLSNGAATQSASYFSRPVRSWKAMKFDNVVKQQTDFSCGAAALATIFNYAYGRQTTEGQVLVNMLKVSDPTLVREKGFSLLDLKRYVKAVGMTGEGYKVPYKALQDLKVPAIALINMRGYKHFVVIRKATPDTVQLADPALGNRVMTRSAFERSWNGVVFAVLGEGYDASSALKNPPPPLSANRLFDMRSPVRDIEIPGYAIENAASVRF